MNAAKTSCSATRTSGPDRTGHERRARPRDVPDQWGEHQQSRHGQPGDQRRAAGRRPGAPPTTARRRGRPRRPSSGAARTVNDTSASTATIAATPTTWSVSGTPKYSPRTLATAHPADHRRGRHARHGGCRQRTHRGDAGDGEPTPARPGSVDTPPRRQPTLRRRRPPPAAPVATRPVRAIAATSRRCRQRPLHRATSVETSVTHLGGHRAVLAQWAADRVGDVIAGSMRGRSAAGTSAASRAAHSPNGIGRPA